MRHLLLASAALLTLPGTALADPATDASARHFKSTVEFLADDLLEGREAGTRGYDIAAQYVATRMEALGLRPGDLDGDYMQRIAFARSAMDKAAPAALIIDGQRFAQGDKIAIGRLPGFKGMTSAAAEAVFVGNGIVLPEYGLDAYQGVDVRGKVVVVAGGLDPAKTKAIPSDVRATLNSAVAQTAASRGAIGVVSMVPDALVKRIGWERIASNAFNPSLVTINANGTPNLATPGLQTSAVMREEALAALFAKSPVPLARVMADLQAGKTIAPFALGTKVSMERTLKDLGGFTSANVVGIIPGSDPKLKDEVIALTAHLDHVGVRVGDGYGPGQAPAKDKAKDDKDRIYNGAMDNATGVASMLEAARLFKESGKAPRRTIMFVALTAEEKGLMGSAWLANNLERMGARKLVGVVNLDMPVVVGDFDRVVAYGAEHSTMGKAVEAAIASIGVKRIEDPVPEETYFVRSDHYEFVKAGIPAIYLDTYPVEAGKAKFKEFNEDHYHHASDEAGLIDWNAGAKFSRLNYNIARAIADADARPMWYAGSYFADKYAKGQARAPAPRP